jgi:hypothetical protein
VTAVSATLNPLVIVTIADGRHNSLVPQECWKPSPGLRAISMARGLIGAGLCYVMMRFLFPQVLLAPVTALAAVSRLVPCVLPFRVRLDRADGKMAITSGFWTKRVPLTRIQRVNETRRLGAEIKLTGGLLYQFPAFKKRRWPERLLRTGTGFEGMETAITQAVAAARAADPLRSDDPDRPTPDNPASILAALAFSGGGLLSMGVATLVRPRADGWLVHLAAALLRTMYWAVGGVFVLFGAWMLYRAWHDRRTAGRRGHAPPYVREN